MNRPKIFKFWVYGLNCSRGRFRLFVLKSDYDKLKKRMEKSEVIDDKKRDKAHEIAQAYKENSK